MRRNASPGRFGTLMLAFALVLGCGSDDGETATVASGIRTQAVATGLPAGATVVVSGFDLEGFWTRLQGTRLYQELKAIQDVQNAMAPLDESRREIQEEICVRFDEETILSLFGGKFDLGFYGSLPEDRADLLLVADVEDEAGARTIVEECEAQLVDEKGATFRDDEVEGSQVRVATNSEGEDVLFYALEDGSLVMATTRERMTSALAMGEDASMTSVSSYTDVIDKLTDATVVVWIDQEAMRQASRSAMADTTGMATGDRERLEAATTALEGYMLAASFGIGFHWSDAGIRGAMYAALPEGSERSPMLEMLTSAPGEIRSLSWQPESTLLYMSMASLDPQVVWEEARKYAIQATRTQMNVAGTADSLTADSLVASQIAAFEAETGIDVEEDLLSWIGEEAAFSITGVDRTGFFPVPEVGITIASRDRQRAQATLTELEGVVSEMASARASIPLQWQEEAYEGQTIRFAPTPMGEGLSIAYAVTDPFVVLGTSRGLVQRMLDAGAGRAQGLPSNPSFTALTEFYPQQSTGLGYVNLEQILTEVEGLMSSFGQMSGNAAVADTTSTARRVVAAMKNAPRIGFYSEADDSGLYSHFLLEVR